MGVQEAPTIRKLPCCVHSHISGSPSRMAKRPLLLLLLAVWVLAGELWLRTEARASPYGVKLCGREFIRAVIFTCGGSRWRRSDMLAHEALGEAGEVMCVGKGGGRDRTRVRGARKGGEMKSKRVPSLHMQLGRQPSPQSCAKAGGAN